MKAVCFLDDALEVIRAFPDDARRETGFQLDRVQRGLDPDDWKPMASIGTGVREIRVRERAGQFRVVYVATRPDAVYVLHAFHKKSQATARRDLELASRRYNDLMRRQG